MFLLKYGRTAAITLVPEHLLRARYPDVYRTKRIVGRDTPFPMREVEATGKKHRTHLELREQRTRERRDRDPQVTTGYGSRTTVQATIPLRGVTDHVRRMSREDEAALEAIDLERDELAAYRMELGKRRAALVKAAWRRARWSVGARELEQIAEQTGDVR
jgi:hypothetical protein